MAQKKQIKKTLIITLVAVGAVLLLTGSFFLRDILIRAGWAEYEKQDILQVKSKYSVIMSDIIKAADGKDFTITAKHGGLFEKAEISGDDNGRKITDAIQNEVDALCHTYCYKITGAGGAVEFWFSESGSKRLIKSDGEPDGYNGAKPEKLGDGWYYIEISPAG